MRRRLCIENTLAGTAFSPIAPPQRCVGLTKLNEGRNPIRACRAGRRISELSRDRDCSNARREFGLGRFPRLGRLAHPQIRQRLSRARRGYRRLRAGNVDASCRAAPQFPPRPIARQIQHLALRHCAQQSDRSTPARPAIRNVPGTAWRNCGPFNRSARRLHSPRRDRYGDKCDAKTEAALLGAKLSRASNAPFGRERRGRSRRCSEPDAVASLDARASREAEASATIRREPYPS